MPPFKRRGRPPKKPDPLGRLMIELRTRSKVWVPCTPEHGRVLRLFIQHAMEDPDLRGKSLDLSPHLEASVRIEAIEAVQFFASKMTPETEPPK